MNNTSSELPCLEQLYFDYFSLLYRLACNQLYRYTGSNADAADMVQEVFLLAARKWSTLKDHPNKVGWLIKATNLLCMNHAQAQYRQQAKEQKIKNRIIHKQPKAFGTLYSEAVEDDTAAQDILISLEQVLRPFDYEIIKAYCIENKSMEEISQQTGISTAALRVRLHRIRQEIAKIFILIVTILASRNI